ncbi:unnamed protein product [Caenorhabditis nigoni]
MSGRFHSIHGDARYLSYQFEVLPLNLAKLSIGMVPIYFIPTIVIMYKMIRKVERKNLRMNVAQISYQLFASFLLVEAANFAVSFTDILIFRLPSTGYVTNWCASSQPNHFLKSLYMIVYVSNYLSRIQPVIFCTIRAIMIYFPKDTTEWNKNILYVCTPLSLVVSIALTSYMIPEYGFCTQLAAPFEFGAVGITIDMNGFVSFSRQAALGYILAVRPFALDFATVIFPIVFFMTHPIFRPKTTTAVVTSVNRIITFSES